MQERRRRDKPRVAIRSRLERCKCDRNFCPAFQASIVSFSTLPGASLRSAPGYLPPALQAEPQHNRLRIQLHRASRPATDGRLQRLCDQLNQTEMTYPGTDATITYELVSAPTFTDGVTIPFPR